MTTNYTVGVTFTGNSSSLNSAAAQAAAAERAVGTAGQQAGQQATAGFDSAQRSLDAINGTLGSVRNQLVGFIGAATAVQVGRGVAHMADDYANIGAQMRQATANAVSFNDAQDVAYGISQRTASSLSSTADLVSKVSRTLRDMGEDGATAFRESAALTESIQQAIALSHVSADSGKAAVIQLTQGLASGVLRGDELNSVLEQTPRLAQAIADGMGVTIGQLRALGAQGMITSAQVVQALRGQADALRTEYADLPLTIDRSWTMLGNAVESYIGKADQASGVSGVLASSIAGIADRIPQIVAGMVSIGAVAAVNLGGKALAAVVAYAGGLKDLVTSQVQAVLAEQAEAAAALDAAKAKSIQVAASLEAVEATRAEAVQKLAAAQADVVVAQRHLDAATAAGVLSFAVREQRIATDQLTAAQARQAAAVNELAATGRMAAGVQSSLTAAAAAQVVAQERMVTVTSLSSAAMMGLQKVGSGLLALLGGWPGVVLAAAAAVVYLSTRQSEAEQTAAKLDETSRRLADAHGQVTQAAIDEAAAQLQAQQAALAAAQANLAALEASQKMAAGSASYGTIAAGAARAQHGIDALSTAVDNLNHQLDASRVAAAFQSNADWLAQMARKETEGFDQLRSSLKDQNTELEKQIATFGKGKAAQLEYAQSLAVSAEQAKGDNNVTRARIASLEALYAPLIENAKRLDDMTAAVKRQKDASKDLADLHRKQAEAARELASANADIVKSQQSLDEQNTELREKLAGLTDQQVEYNRGVRDAVQAYQEWLRAGVPVAQAEQDLQTRYDQLNERLQLKNQLDAEDINNAPKKAKSYKTQTDAAERYYQVIEQGAKTAADAIGNYFVQNVRSIGDLWHGLVDSAKQVVAQIISTWLQLRVLQPFLGGLFGGGMGGGWVGTASSLYGLVGGNSAGSTSTGGVTGATGAGGSSSYAGYLQNVSQMRSLYSSMFGGTSGTIVGGNSIVSGPGLGGAGYGVNMPNGAVMYSNGTTVTPYSPYGGMANIGGYSLPYASVAGGVLGAYYGAHQGDGGLGTVGSTVAYGALGAGIAGTAAGVAGGASLGSAAGSAFGTAAASSSWIPIVGWIAALAALVDHFSGGKVFGTKYRTDASQVDLNVGPTGASADASVHQWKYQSQLSQALGNFGVLLPSGWGAKDNRLKPVETTPEMTKAAQQLFDSLQKTMVQGAQKLAVSVPDMIDATISAQSTYDKKGKLKSTDYLVEYLGQTWKEATADAAAQRLGAEALISVIQKSAGDGVQQLAQQFRDTAADLADASQAMLEAQTDITKGNSLIALGATATLAEVITFTQTMQQSGETLQAAYERLANASAAYTQFVGQFQPTSTAFGASLEAIAKQMQANIDQANALAQAAGLQGANESDLANIHQQAAQQAADAMAQLSASAQDLATKLYGTTQSLASATSLTADLTNKVQAAARLAIGDNSPLSTKDKLDVALQGLRSGVTSADDVLALGRQLYSSSADYTGLYNKVMSILNLPGTDAGSGSDIKDVLKNYNNLAATADATQRFGDAKTLAQYVADISTTHGISYGEAAGGLGFSLNDLAKDLGVTNLTAYLDNLKLADIPGTTLDASASIVDAIQQLGRDLIQTLTGAPITDATITTKSTGTSDPQQIALLQSIDARLAAIEGSSDTTASTNVAMAKQGSTDALRAIQSSSRSTA